VVLGLHLTLDGLTLIVFVQRHRFAGLLSSPPAASWRIDLRDLGAIAGAS
jgi:hypothetical protein